MDFAFRLAVCSLQLLLEQSLAPALLVAREDKWKPVADLNAESRKETPGSLAHQKRAHSSGIEATGKQPSSAREQNSPGAEEAAELLLSKSKVKERFVFVEKDVRQLKPPRGRSLLG